MGESLRVESLEKEIGLWEGVFSLFVLIIVNLLFAIKVTHFFLKIHTHTKHLILCFWF